MRKLLAIAAVLCVAAFEADGQDLLQSVAGGYGMYPAFVSFPSHAQPDFVPGSVLLEQQDAFISSSETILLHSEPDPLGQEHYRYQQKINNIPVEGAVYVVHVSGGKVVSENGDWIAKIPAELASYPSINDDLAFQTAVTTFGARTYKWEVASEEQFLKTEKGDVYATFKKKPELVYYSGEQEISSENIRLAWKVDIYAHEPMDRRIYFIDARTGQVLGKREMIHTNNATGTAVTAYSGTKTVVTDQASANSFLLRESTRGYGVYTLNMNKGTDYSQAMDFSDADNYWNNANSNLDQYATDAHWGAEMTYDYFKNTFNRNSINNAGFAIVNYVHYASNYFNAFWDGSRMTYGDGNSADNYKPLTSVDVCGHEIAHGLTSFTAALNYSGESGALNEGFSDIFGTTIEFYANPSTANWLLGEAFYTVRSMSSPKTFGQPNTYQGTNWATGTSDNGGVHTNSGVLNYWYYLLVNGGSGTNDKSYAYSVTGIGLTKAAAIAYRTLTVYLTATSQYANARYYTLQAATDLYGASSNEVTQVANAWNAVGVSASSASSSSGNGSNSNSNITCGDNYESNENKQNAKTISVDADITARISSGSDKDWFVFTTSNAAPKLKVTLSNLPMDYDIKLYNASGSQLVNAHNSGTTAESITYNSNTNGATYYVQVYGHNNSQYSLTNCYTLRAATSNVNQLFDDGDSSESFVVEHPEGQDYISVFPNPAKDDVMLHFYSTESRAVSIIVSDMTGRVLAQKNVDASEGSNSLSVSLAGYFPGIYTLRVADKPAVKFQVLK
jgi:Zn-dependent metalloprotease